MLCKIWLHLCSQYYTAIVRVEMLPTFHIYLNVMIPKKGSWILVQRDAPSCQSPKPTDNASPFNVTSPSTSCVSSILPTIQIFVLDQSGSELNFRNLNFYWVVKTGLMYHSLTLLTDFSIVEAFVSCGATVLTLFQFFDDLFFDLCLLHDLRVVFPL